MLERLTIRNFKGLREVSLELGDRVVLVGPNNSGKTSALQALALWRYGVERWLDVRGARPSAKQRTGVTLNRRDLTALPVPAMNLLWTDLHVRATSHGPEGRRRTQNIRVQVEVEGVTDDKPWTCGLEFDYANAESAYCRPLGWAEGGPRAEEPIPAAAAAVRVTYLPPMSGLAAQELRLDEGAVQVRIGEGRTAEVLRNLCYAVVTAPDGAARWAALVGRVRDLFGVTLEDPVYLPGRGELTMSYRDRGGATLDLSAAGRGMQQTLLLLAYLEVNPGSVLLLDEPDAHLEILRQRQIYTTLGEAAERTGSQLLVATHSEVLLKEAVQRDVVLAFIGAPHRVDDRGSQLHKALSTIPFEDYLGAEERGWVLYLEGSTDLAILQAFARTLDHEVAQALEAPAVHYIFNQPKKAEEHFYGLREAVPGLRGVALTDRLDRPMPQGDGVRSSLRFLQWSRREIENYLCDPEVLVEYAGRLASTASHGPLFENARAEEFREIMRACVEERIPPVALRDPSDRWWSTVKASDELLDPVFERFFERVGLGNRMRKTNYHRLAALVPRDRVDPEIRQVLDAIAATARHPDRLDSTPDPVAR